MKIINNIKNKINKMLDNTSLLLENRNLQNKVKEEQKKNSLLIDLKNRYLSDLRSKNLMNGQLKKENEKLKKEIDELKARLKYDII